MKKSTKYALIAWVFVTLAGIVTRIIVDNPTDYFIISALWLIVMISFGLFSRAYEKEQLTKLMEAG